MTITNQYVKTVKKADANLGVCDLGYIYAQYRPGDINTIVKVISKTPFRKFCSGQGKYCDH